MRRIGTQDGLFIPGNPATQTQGTTVTADWLNALQEELAGAVEGFGGTLDPEDNGQLFDWLIASLAMKVGDASQIFRVAAAVGNNDATPLSQVQALLTALIASTAEAQAMTDNTKALSPLRLKEALQGGNQSLGANGYQKLPGGLIVQWGVLGNIAYNQASGVSFNFPITFPNNCFEFVSTGFAAMGVTNFANINPLSINISGVQYQASSNLASGTFSVRWMAVGN